MKHIIGIAAALALLLSGCGIFQSSTPQPLPTVMLGDDTAPAASSTAAPAASGGTTHRASPSGGDVTASGVLAPAQETNLAFASAARVEWLEVKAGDPVKANQVLARLAGSERLAAAAEAANLELISAQKALDDLNESAAQARAGALLRLAKAKDALDTAEKRRGWQEYRVGSDNQLDVARADLILAEDNLKRVEEAYGSAASSENDDLNKAAALTALSAARKARDKAQANLNYLLSMPNSIAVEKADAELEVARAEVDAAQRELDKWKDGPDPAQVELAQARIQNAQAQVAASQAALADLQLVAPFDGTLTRLDILQGEWALPGQPIMTIADLAHLRVKTTDLSERDVPKIHTGQQVIVWVKPLNQEVPGKVSEIAFSATSLGGDVVYETTIDMDAILDGMRVGMSVEVSFK